VKNRELDNEEAFLYVARFLMGPVDGAIHVEDFVALSFRDQQASLLSRECQFIRRIDQITQPPSDYRLFWDDFLVLIRSSVNYCQKFS
jgi:hypothetical protein